MLWQDSPKKSWAQMKSSAISMERSMGPFRCFGRTHRRNPGPIQNHRPLLWGDQWAHSGASARLTEEILGPYGIIGHFYGEINGPIQVLRQDSPKNFWAHTKSLATSVSRSMGPLRWFGKTRRKHYRLTKNYCCFSGPIQDYCPHYSVLSVGPFRIIGNTIQCWLWADPILLTPLLQWAHSGLLTL